MVEGKRNPLTIKVQECLPEAGILRENWSWHLEFTRTQWCLPTSCLPCFSHPVNPVPPPGISTVSTAFFSLNFLCLRDQPRLAFLHPSSKFWRMGNQLAHFGSSNFPSPVVYGKEKSLAEPIWVQKCHLSVCFWIVRRNIPEKANQKTATRDPLGSFHL